MSNFTIVYRQIAILNVSELFTTPKNVRSPFWNIPTVTWLNHVFYLQLKSTDDHDISKFAAEAKEHAVKPRSFF